MTTAPDREPWLRQPRESEEKFRQFAAYRDGERDLGRLAVRLGQPVERIRMTSSTWRWSERAREWDREADRRWLDDGQRRINAMRERQSQVVSALLNLGLRELAKRAHESASTSEPTATVRDIIDLLDRAVKLDRQLAGEADVRVGVTHALAGVRPSDLSDEQIARIRAGEDPHVVLADLVSAAIH
jgi:hypothetical protein